jgi:serine/threonine-protein kinase
LTEQIGEGGMGVVYRGRYVVNNREVAVKMLPADVTDKTVLARFERELEVLKSLKHKNIVRCFGGVCEDKGRFYAMELVTGGTLEHELQRRGRLPWEAVVQYGLQICAALECAHKQGVVHRDVKPSNFLLTEDGQLKLSDFGLAMMAAARKITQAGKTAGTFLYMAPEQIRGQEVTPRTDLYALGCVFYELLTGKPPFLAETPAATLHMHLKEAPQRLSQQVFDCPTELGQIVARLMEKDPARRYGTADEVAKELRMVTPVISVRSPKRSLTAIAREPEPPDTSTREILPQAPAAPISRLPSWLTTMLGVAVAVMAVALLEAWPKRTAAIAWERNWIAAMDAADPQVQVFAARQLGKSPWLTDAGLEALNGKMEFGPPETRLAAVRALADAKGMAKGSLPMLRKLRKDAADSVLREAAAEAEKEIATAPGRRNYMSWFLSVVLMIVAAGGFAFWLRSVPRIPRPRWIMG